MWNQAWGETLDGSTSQRFERKTLQVLPCTVSQLLAAARDDSHTFTICNCQLNQVSVVGIIRGLAPFVTHIQYSVDDMTGPPLNVRLWVNSENVALTSASPGTYVKVIGSLRDFSGERSVLAMNIRCIKDMNEITSHMLTVVEAHMQLFGKKFDVNMNTTASSYSEDLFPKALSTIHGQVLEVVRKFSPSDTGISFHELQTQLDYLREGDLRASLKFLMSDGHIFYTIDEHHFKSTEY